MFLIWYELYTQVITVDSVKISLPEEHITFSHLWIYAAYLDSLFELFAFTPWTKQCIFLGEVFLKLYITMVMRKCSGATTCLIASSARYQNSHIAKRSPLTAAHGWTKQLWGYVSVAGRFRRRFLTPLDWRGSAAGEGDALLPKSIFLLFTPPPLILYIFNVYKFYLSWHIQHTLWRHR